MTAAIICSQISRQSGLLRGTYDTDSHYKPRDEYVPDTLASKGDLLLPLREYSSRKGKGDRDLAFCRTYTVIEKSPNAQTR